MSEQLHSREANFSHKALSRIAIYLLIAAFFVSYLLLNHSGMTFATIGSPLLTGSPAASGSAESAPDSGPTTISAKVEPSKVKSGDIMTVTAEVEDAHGIKSVTADMGSIETIDLQLVEGNIYRGVWQSNWRVHSTEEKKYITTITATNVLGQQATAEVEWSDPVVSDTFTDATKIASNVNLIVSGGQVYLSCIANGQACSSGANCCSNNCYRDADSDGYAAASGDKVCKASASSGTDCDDTTNTKWQSLTCYKDDDSDTYTLAGAALCTGASCSSPDTTYKSSASSPLDCYDANASANPVQTTFFTTHRGDGSFDFNCDGAQTPTGIDCMSSCPGSGCIAGCSGPGTCKGGWLTATCGAINKKVTSCRSYTAAGCTGGYYGTITTSCTGTPCLPAGDPCNFGSQWFGTVDQAKLACR